MSGANDATDYSNSNNAASTAGTTTTTTTSSSLGSRAEEGAALNPSLAPAELPMLSNGAGVGGNVGNGVGPGSASRSTRSTAAEAEESLLPDTSAGPNGNSGTTRRAVSPRVHVPLTGAVDGDGNAITTGTDTPITPSYGNYGRNTPSFLDLNYRNDSAGVRRKPTENDPLLLQSWKKTDDELKALKKSKQGRKLARFYKHQNAQIDTLLEKHNDIDDDDDPVVRFATRASFGVNIVLFCLQTFAASTSGSLSLFATMADSFMDLFSSCVLMVAERMSGNRSREKYPTGATRMETAGIIVFSCLMASVSVQLIIESLKRLLDTAPSDATVTAIAAACVGFALLSKFCLFLLCMRRAKVSHTCRTLAQDHRNDLFVNSFGLAASLLGTKIAGWIDPVGAILIALIILRSWVGTAFECIQLIVGKSADPAFLSKITYLAVTHHPLILQVDTCRAYHAGPAYYVEVDIVMDPDLKVRTAHDIAESLQIKIEKLPQVERAFVHIDYEITHKASDEHKRA